MCPSFVFTWLLELWSKVTSTGAGLQVAILDIGQSFKEKYSGSILRLRFCESSLMISYIFSYQYICNNCEYVNLGWVFVGTDSSIVCLLSLAPCCCSPACQHSMLNFKFLIFNFDFLIFNVWFLLNCSPACQHLISKLYQNKPGNKTLNMKKYRQKFLVIPLNCVQVQDLEINLKAMK